MAVASGNLPITSDWILVADCEIFLECVAWLNIQNLYFSYKFLCIFVKEIVEVFSQSDVIGKFPEATAIYLHKIFPIVLFVFRLNLLVEFV